MVIICVGDRIGGLGEGLLGDFFWDWVLKWVLKLVVDLL